MSDGSCGIVIGGDLESVKAECMFGIELLTLYRSIRNAMSINERVSNESNEAANAALSNALPPPFVEYLPTFTNDQK
jgi:hypothetical protein